MLNIIYASEEDARKAGYSRNRDVAYIFTPILWKSMALLEEINWPAWMADYLKHTGTTEDMLGEGARRLAAAVQHFTGDENVKAFDDALDAVKFYDLPKPIQIAIFASIGFLSTGTFFVGLRDVTFKGEPPPFHKAIKELLNTAERVATRFAMPRWLRSILRGTSYLRWLYKRVVSSN